MSGILCKVTKNYENHYRDELIEVDPKDLDRLERRGRVKRILDTRIDHRLIGAIPPSLGEPSKKPKMIFVDKRDIKKQPTITFNKKEESPPITPVVGPPQDRLEKTPAAELVGPDLTKPILTDSTKYLPEIKAVQINQF